MLCLCRKDVIKIEIVNVIVGLTMRITVDILVSIESLIKQLTEHFDTRIVGGDIFEAANCDKSVDKLV